MADPILAFDVTYSAALLVIDVLALVALRRKVPLWVAAIGWGLAAFCACVAAADLNGRGLFAVMRGGCWALFLHGPLLWVVAGWWRWREGGGGGESGGRAGMGLAGVGLAGLLIGADAFLVEPKWLEVSRVKVAGLPVKIALIADLQTDDVGDYEAMAIQRAREEAPDLVLFAGDYLHVRNRPIEQEVQELRALLQTLSPRLGSYAVRGDVESSGWEKMFEGTGVIATGETARFELPGITLTALSQPASRQHLQGARTDIAPASQFHVVLGHAPDYALDHPPADLLLAGHTHGGQVRLPGIGPLITLSDVPRAWAAGVTALPRGTLVVSRGIGMERGEAPRLRFLCRPELVILEPG